MQLTLNDSVLSLTSGDHGSKIWLDSGGQSVILITEHVPACLACIVVIVTIINSYLKAQKEKK